MMGSPVDDLLPLPPKLSNESDSVAVFVGADGHALVRRVLPEHVVLESEEIHLIQWSCAASEEAAVAGLRLGGDWLYGAKPTIYRVGTLLPCVRTSADAATMCCGRPSATATHEAS